MNYDWKLIAYSVGSTLAFFASVAIIHFTWVAIRYFAHRHDDKCDERIQKLDGQSTLE